MIRLTGGPVQAAIWQRVAIPPDEVIAGPAIIEQADTTILVEPEWTATRTAGDTLLLERRA
jgi:N-methylhydantoinase A/oxoprolinase/acetone carboxylase beta subunit